MNSCMYECRVMHQRMKPKLHRFEYPLFMFYLDLDEIDVLSKRLRLLSRNRFNFFSFRDADHIRVKSSQVKQDLASYLHTQGVELGNGRAYLLTHLRIFGYVFNPVSFYFCFDETGKPLCAVPEVRNTFGEMKLFFAGTEHWMGNRYFLKREPKYFYVSPFFDLDVEFEFRLPVPDERLAIQVDDVMTGEKIFFSTLQGTRVPLTDRKLLFFLLKYPLLTFFVVFWIHWQAFLLYLRKIPYRRKGDNPELQREVQIRKS